MLNTSPLLLHQLQTFILLLFTPSSTQAQTIFFVVSTIEMKYDFTIKRLRGTIRKRDEGKTIEKEGRSQIKMENEMNNEKEGDA